jgi:hypothetical protein
VSLNPTNIAGGNPVTGTVSLSRIAPSGGAVVSLLSSNPSAATVPPAVSVPEGSASANFTVTTTTVSSSTPVIISATYNGITKSSTLSVNPAVNQAPQVSISSPTSGTKYTAPATVTINASGTDTDGWVTKIELFQGTTKLGESTSSTISFAWSNIAAGTYLLTAKATDNLGTVATSSGVTITVNPPINQPPVVNITSPSNNTVFTPLGTPATVVINATATDPDGLVAKVEFFQGTAKLGESTSSPYIFTWNNVAAGPYTLIAKATDTLGATGTSAAVDITVNPPINQPPTIEITSPTSGSTYTAPASIPITAFATDSDGSVAKVEFIQTSIILGQDTTYPYSFTWSNVPAGTYALTARATDNLGAVTTSPTIVNVTVNPAPIGAIGNTNDGVAADNIYDNGAWINACRFRASSNMTVSMIKAKISGAGKYKCAIYADSNGSPRTFLRGTAELTNPASGWQTMNLSSSLNLTSGTYYWLAIWSDSSAARVYYTNSGTLRWGKYNYGSWPTSLNTTGGGTFNYCIYAQ